MSFKKKFISLAICGAIFLGSINFAFADGSRVVTIGANLSSEQRATMLKYFGVNENEVQIIEVNNQEERKYLEGVASEAQLGTKTFSCAYVEPKTKGNGINVKTANLTWLTSSMVASTLSTAGLTDADCVVASVFPVSGTGALTGIMKAFEDATGKPLDEDKKELASEELIITGDIADGMDDKASQDKATGMVNDIKTEIIKNGTSDTTQIAETINNITNNYNITLSANQEKQLQELMEKISKQDYDYNEMKDTLNGIKDTVNDKLNEVGEGVSNSGMFDSIKNWFAGVFKGNDKKDLGILGSTNDSILGKNAIIDATNLDAIDLPTKEEAKGFFSKISDWFSGMFGSNNSSNDDSSGKDTTSDDSGLNPENEESTHFDNENK